MIVQKNQSQCCYDMDAHIGLVWSYHGYGSVYMFACACVCVCVGRAFWLCVFPIHFYDWLHEGFKCTPCVPGLCSRTSFYPVSWQNTLGLKWQTGWIFRPGLLLVCTWFWSNLVLVWFKNTRKISHNQHQIFMWNLVTFYSYSTFETEYICTFSLVGF